MSKKRKRVEFVEDGRTSKKIAVDRPIGSFKVSIVEDETNYGPVLASTPGLSLPSKTRLKPYEKPRSHANRGSFPGPELLLHSSAHPTLDYTAREEASHGSDNYLKHYLGVYDPTSGELKLVQARTIVVRSTLQSARPSASNLQNLQESKHQNPTSARTALGLAFGTKKSQKAIRSQTANAIEASPSKFSTTSSPNKTLADPLAFAVVSSMAGPTSTMPTREEMQQDIDANKPRPKPNLNAETPADVYSIEQLVGGAQLLQQMRVRKWIEKVEAEEDVQTTSLFVARRLRGVVKEGDVKRVRVLKFLLLLVEWFRCLKSAAKGSKRVPRAEELGLLVEEWGSEVVMGLGRRFAEGSQLNRWHIDNLITHIFALAFTIDNYTTDTHDIREDLKLENKSILQYYKELGCAVTTPTEAERTKMGISKAEASTHRIARLRLPLAFPKMKVLASRRR